MSTNNAMLRVALPRLMKISARLLAEPGDVEKDQMDVVAAEIQLHAVSLHQDVQDRPNLGLNNSNSGSSRWPSGSNSTQQLATEYLEPPVKRPWDRGQR